ncbi:hypothetical protein ACHQM5_021421 [Ranunculus cassubicifolius]
MKEASHNISSRKNLEVTGASNSKKASKGHLVANVPKYSLQRSIKRIDTVYHSRPEFEFAGHIALFLLKVAALEIVRRFSKAKCPVVWHGVQALQVLCYTPLKWIQRWTPLMILVKGMQQLSRPILCLSVATALIDPSDSSEDNSNPSDGSQSNSYPQLEPQTEQQTQDASSERLSDQPQNELSENWLLQLYKELDTQNLILPERINEDELRRFYAAANGDFSLFFSSIKKTIKWRETYNILTPQELEPWADLVFWHGRDKKLRPCLFVRLGVASSTLAFSERPRFTQAIVSQIEHGVLHLVNNLEDPQITVLMDCEGLSPLNFPMRMLRSCSSLVQDHYPNHLGCLFIIRLAPVVRVVAQTFIQMLKPVTRQKLRVEGETYKKVLSEYLQTIPKFLGGDCGCPRCCPAHLSDSETTTLTERNGNFPSLEEISNLYSHRTSAHLDGVDYDQVLKKAVMAMLMLLIFVGFLMAMYGPELPLLSI